MLMYTVVAKSDLQRGKHKGKHFKYEGRIRQTW